MKRRIAYVFLAGVAVCVASVILQNTVLSPKGTDATAARTWPPLSVPRAAARPAAPPEEPPILAADLDQAPNTAQPLVLASSAARTLAAAASPAPTVPPGAAKTPAGATAAVRPPLSYDEIVQRARQVQNEAERRVARLDDQVGLTDEQYARAFVVYARASSAYDPSIPIEGQVAPASSTPAASGNTAASGSTAAVVATAAAGKSTDGQIYETLNEDQQAAFGQAWLDRDLWWTEIVSQLAADFPEPKASDTSTAVSNAVNNAVQPSAHQTDNIFDILNSVQ